MALLLELPNLEQETLLTATIRAPRQPVTPALPCAQQRDVHVWELPLDQSPPNAVDLLDATEQARAQRFVHALHRTRYIAAHAWLRRILGRYLDRAPQDLRFDIGPYGKPELRPLQPDKSQPAPLRFNLSHSNDIALLAVSTGVDVGVDIEAIRPDLPDATLAAGVLTALELAELEQLPTSQRAEVFFACWARKEACMKALGLGLALEPKRLHVGMAAQRQQLRPLQSDGPLDLCLLHAPGGYAAALAVVGGFGQVTSHSVDEPSWRLT